MKERPRSEEGTQCSKLSPAHLKKDIGLQNASSFSVHGERKRKCEKRVKKVKTKSEKKSEKG